jgi:hypothetical protein
LTVNKTFLEDCQSVAEYARARGKSPATAYNWINRGLPVFAAFGRMLVHIPTADAWMRERTGSKNAPRDKAAAEVAR